MHRALLIATLAAVLALPAHAPADEGEVMAGVRKQAEPLLYALGLIGSPYKTGGSDPARGVDCSGFVRHVYRESASVDLPHNAKEISKTGTIVAKEDVKPGDLVFFNTLKRPFSHVGIYAGDGKFVHASSRRSKQVTISDMNERYWARRYQGARRILPNTSN